MLRHEFLFAGTRHGRSSSRPWWTTWCCRCSLAAGAATRAAPVDPAAPAPTIDSVDAVDLARGRRGDSGGEFGEPVGRARVRRGVLGRAAGDPRRLRRPDPRARRLTGRAAHARGRLEVRIEARRRGDRGDLGGDRPRAGLELVRLHVADDRLRDRRRDRRDRAAEAPADGIRAPGRAEPGEPAAPRAAPQT